MEAATQTIDYRKENKAGNLDSVLAVTPNGSFIIEGRYHDDGIMLRGGEMERLPEGLSTGGTLDLTYCDKLNTLPGNLTVAKNLYLSHSHLRQLPKGLKIGQSLYCQNSGLKELPEDLDVGGKIIAGSNLKSGNGWIISNPLGIRKIVVIYNKPKDIIYAHDFRGSLEGYQKFITENPINDSFERCFAPEGSKKKDISGYLEFIKECRKA